MIVATIADAQPGEKSARSLCSAWRKTTQLASQMQGKGLLVSMRFLLNAQKSYRKTLNDGGSVMWW